MKPKKRGPKPKLDLPDLPGPPNLARLQQGTAMALTQVKVPRPLFVAVKQQLGRDKLTLRQLVRWAMVEYLALREPDKADRTWRQCV